MGVYLISMALDAVSLSILMTPPYECGGMSRFVEHLVKVERFILGRSQTRTAEGHFVCVHVRSIHEASPTKRKRKCVGASDEKSVDLEWLLVDSMNSNVIVYTSFGALVKVSFFLVPFIYCGHITFLCAYVKGFIGSKRTDVPPFLIIPLVYSDNALNALNTHVSNLGSLFDGLLQSTSNSIDSSQSFSESDVISLLLMLVERKTAPAHGLSLSMICTLLSGERSLEEFGLEYQVLRVCVLSVHI
jgi:hypothetical protein